MCIIDQVKALEWFFFFAFFFFAPCALLSSQPLTASKEGIADKFGVAFLSLAPLIISLRLLSLEEGLPLKALMGLAKAQPQLLPLL